MYHNPAKYIFLLFFSGISLSLAQDAIYKIDGITINGNFEYVEGNSVYYKLIGSTDLKKLDAKEVSLITSNKGNIAFMDGSQNTLTLNDTPYDLLYLSSSRVVPVNSFQLNSDHIQYTDLEDMSQKVSVREVDVIVYTNNRILPLKPMPEAIRSLVRLDNYEIPLPSQKTITSTTSETAPHIPPTENEAQPVQNTPQTPTVSALPQGPTLPVDREEFKAKSMSKAKQFENYLVRIMDKNTSRIDQKKIANQIIPLFISDTSIIEVSNVFTQEKYQHYLRGYLNHIITYDYTKIEIEWVEINYVGNIVKGRDGNWYGTITFTQKFKGYRGDYVAYEDQTTKTLTVVLKTYERIIDGKVDNVWDVFLSNISVEHTS